MREYEEIIKKSKMESIILKVIVIIVCVVLTYFNSTTYLQIFGDGTIVSNLDELNLARKNNISYVKVDLTKANLEQYQLKNENDENDIIDLYVLYLNGKNFLVKVDNNTAITTKVPLEIVKTDTQTADIIDKIKLEKIIDIDTTFYLTNVDYAINQNIIKYEFYATCVIGIYSLITIVLDLIFFINPKKTLKYKKELKKYNKGRENIPTNVE